jgi:hypothetical protein
MRTEYRQSASAALLVFCVILLLLMRHYNLLGQKFCGNLLLYFVSGVLSTFIVGHLAARSSTTWTFSRFVIFTVLAYAAIFGLEILAALLIGFIAGLFHLKL